MHLIPAGASAERDRDVGYSDPHATSHTALDRDQAFQDETRNAAMTLAEAVTAKRHGSLIESGSALKDVRPK